MSGRYSTITLDECLAVAKNRLGLRTTDQDIWLNDLANESIRHLDAPSVFIQQICTLDIEDKKSKLPCGFYSLLGLRFGSGNSCSELVYADLTFLRECGCTTAWNVISSTGYFQISDGYIFYHLIPDNATEVTLSFMGLNVDSQGRGIVYEDYRRAIVAYICYSFCLANMDDTKYRAQMDIHRLTWQAQKKWIQSNDVRNQFHNEKHQIRSIMNSWVSSKRNWNTI